MLAARLVWAGALWSLLENLVRSPDLFREPVVAGAVLVPYVLAGLLALAIHRGHAWAKVLLVAGVGFYVAHALVRYEATSQELAQGFWAAFHFGVAFTTRVAAAAVLVKAYFREPTTARVRD